MSKFTLGYTLEEESQILQQAAALRNYAAQYNTLITEVWRVRVAADSAWNSSSGTEWKQYLERWAENAESCVNTLTGLAASMEKVADDHHGLLEGLVDLFS